MDDEYYDQDGHEYEMTVAQEEAFHEGLLSDLVNSIEGDEYPIDFIVDRLQSAFNKRGYAIQFFLQSDQYKKNLTD